MGELIRLSVIELARFQSEEGRLISSIEFIFSSFPICGTGSVIFFFFFFYFEMSLYSIYSFKDKNLRNIFCFLRSNARLDNVMFE